MNFRGNGMNTRTSTCSRPCAVPAICSGLSETNTTITARIRASTGSLRWSITNSHKSTKP